jgi:hypothetical protein
MRARVLSWVAFLLVLAQPVAARGAGARASKYSQATLLKNWALCRCLAKAYGPGAPADDAEKSAAGYLEFGKAPIEAYEEATKLVEKYSGLSYGGSVKSDYDTMKCIDLFHSKELDELAKRYAGKR